MHTAEHFFLTDHKGMYRIETTGVGCIGSFQREEAFRLQAMLRRKAVQYLELIFYISETDFTCDAHNIRPRYSITTQGKDLTQHRFRPIGTSAITDYHILSYDSLDVDFTIPGLSLRNMAATTKHLLSYSPKSGRIIC